MTSVSEKAAKGSFSLTAYRGDVKTLLAFNLAEKDAQDLAGFTIQCKPDGQDPYYVHNQLQFENASGHSQDPKEPANSSINAPIHKFRWIHVPGSIQDTQPLRGKYIYTVTPRFFDKDGALQPLDQQLGASVTIMVDGFQTKGLELGFTRGYVQSQAFVHHFGPTATIQPVDKANLIFDTSKESGVNASGEHFTYQEQYEWLGFTAREKVFGILNEVLKDTSLRLDMFAYDLNEPDVLSLLLKLGKQGRVRIILDNASLHHASTPKKSNAKAKAKSSSKKTMGPPREDRFEQLFNKTAKKGLLLRGKFGRYAHDKVFVVRNKANGAAKKVLTGSTNFSITGLYVNSNHVLVFNDPKVAAAYAGVFDEAWNDGVAKTKFAKSKWATQSYSFSSPQTPKTTITFSPHDTAFTNKLLQAMVTRIKQEGKKGSSTGSVLFAVMEIGMAKNVVYNALNNLHKQQNIFSFGISDNPQGIALFPLGEKTGVLVTGKPASTKLPEPFNQVPDIGLGHQVHHKFVVCGFNRPDAVVYCGSSNLAEGGEENNGDNLLAISDGDVATVFAIEALLLVDHFNFLDSRATKGKQSEGRAAARKKPPPASKTAAAVAEKWFLSTDGKWAAKYFDPKDLHSVDRQLFA